MPFAEASDDVVIELAASALCILSLSFNWGPAVYSSLCYCLEPRFRVTIPLNGFTAWGVTSDATDSDYCEAL